MFHCQGYGFNANSNNAITNAVLVDFIRKYDPYMFGEMAETILGRNVAVRKSLSEQDMEKLRSGVLDEIFKWEGSVPEFIVDVINGHEQEKGLKSLLLTHEGDYVVFYPTLFVAEDDRYTRVPSREALKSVIAEYIPGVDIEYGEVWEGNDADDPVYEFRVDNGEKE